MFSEIDVLINRKTLKNKKTTTTKQKTQPVFLLVHIKKKKIQTFSGRVLNITSTSEGWGMNHKLRKTFPSADSKHRGRGWKLLQHYKKVWVGTAFLSKKEVAPAWTIYITALQPQRQSLDCGDTWAGRRSLGQQASFPGRSQVALAINNRGEEQWGCF